MGDDRTRGARNQRGGAPDRATTGDTRRRHHLAGALDGRRKSRTARRRHTPCQRSARSSRRALARGSDDPACRWSSMVVHTPSVSKDARLVHRQSAVRHGGGQEFSTSMPRSPCSRGIPAPVHRAFAARSSRNARSARSTMWSSIKEAIKRGLPPAGPAAARLRSEFARIRDELGELPGRIVDAQRLRSMLGHLGRTLHVGLLADCSSIPIRRSASTAERDDRPERAGVVPLPPGSLPERLRHAPSSGALAGVDRRGRTLAPGSAALIRFPTPGPDRRQRAQAAAHRAAPERGPPE